MNLKEKLMRRLGKLLLRSLTVVYFTDWEYQSGVRNPDPTGAFNRAYEEISWVYTCVWNIASFTAMVPFKLYKETKQGELELLPRDHPAVNLFRYINPIETQFGLWSAIALCLELFGTAYILKTRPGKEYSGKPDELWLLQPHRVDIIPSKDGFMPEGYKYKMGQGKIIVFPAEMVAVIKYPSPTDPLYGQGSVKALQRTLRTDWEAQRFNMHLLMNQARPFGAIKVSGFLTKEQREQLRKEWDRVHKGAAKAGRPALLQGDVDWLDMSKSPHDIEFAELRKMMREEIIAGFGLFPTVVGLPTANYATARQQRRMFAENTMIPKLTLIEQSLTKFLLADFGDDIIGKFDYSNVPALKDDETLKAKIAATLVDKRIMSPNEVRQKFYKLEPYRGGDEMLAPMTLVPIGSSEAKKSVRAVEHTPKQAQRWYSYYRRITNTEKQAQRWLRDMFDLQEKETIKRLKRSRELRSIDDMIDEVMLIETTEPTLRKVITSAAQQGIEHGAEPLDFIDVDFDLENPELVAWMNKHAAKAVTDTVKTTKRMLREQLVEALENGESIQEIEKRIHEVFDHRRNNVVTIARTEVLRGVQKTQHLLWEAAKVVKKKEWISSMAPNMRPEHGAINGETVELNMPFSIGVMFPGDPDGDPSMTINCLCDMAPVVEAEEKVACLINEITNWIVPEVAGEGSKRWRKQKELAALLER